MADEPLLIDEYQLLNPVATGNFTTVWEVVEKGGTRHYAMKLLLPEAFEEAEQRNVLKHEAKVAERLQHPNLVQFHKLVMSKKRGYIVMDYFRAANLKTQINNDLLSVQVRFARLAEQLCQVIAYMHDQGFLHRDIKPDNILFNKGSELRLIDFSLSSRIAGAVTKMLSTKKGKLIQGTRTYIAPETIKKEVPTPQTDMYSLGVTFFEILTGEPPFKGSSPDELLKKHVGHTPPEPSLINRNISPEMDRLIMRMLAKKPKDRHRSMHEVTSELRNLRVYKEDVEEVAAKLAKEQEAKQNVSLDKASRLDSRADAVRSQMVRENPELAKVHEAERKKLALEKQRREQEMAARAARVATKSGSSAPAGGPALKQPAPQTPKPQAPAPQQPPAPYPPAGMPGGAPIYPMPGYPPGPFAAPQYGMPPAAGFPGAPSYGAPPYGMPQYPGPGYGNIPAYGAPPQYPPQYAPPGQPGPPAMPGPPGLPQGAGAPPQYPPQYAPPGQGMPYPPLRAGQPAGQPVVQPGVPAPPGVAAPNRPVPAGGPPSNPPAANRPGGSEAYWQELPPLDNPPQLVQNPQKPAPRPPEKRSGENDLPLMDELPPVE